MRAFQVFLIFLFCISSFFADSFCGGRHSKPKSPTVVWPLHLSSFSSSSSSFGSESESECSESFDTEVNEDEVVRKIDELLRKDDNSESESDDYDSGYEGDDECDYKDCFEVAVSELLGVRVEKIFEKVSQLKQIQPQFYNFFTMEKNRKKALDKLLFSDPNNNIRRVEICSALGYAKELEEVLNRSKRIAIIRTFYKTF